eukprot:gnl/Trimastix_PCT/1822.p1 GENE.gnl/Trimastix_PCT/1822~~gnl/Trimastix_PCT/1822.p1  ORF type:complete len:984 (+),score=295.40 gnl/Trimastix_PCT/1822:210-2954(+)
MDYQLIPGPCWKKLHQWYGGGPEIARKIIKVGTFGDLQVEIFPLKLKLIRTLDDGRPDMSSEKVVIMSRKALASQLIETAAETYEVDRSQVRVWDYYQATVATRISEPSRSLEDIPLMSDQHILVEIASIDGSWPRTKFTQKRYTGGLTAPSTRQTQLTSTSSFGSYPSTYGTRSYGASSYSYGSDPYGYRSAPAPGRGLVGLHNLGNTCFMNSALQCLGNSVPLVNYFLRGRHHQELNRDNPLGMHGRIATEYAKLVHSVWKGDASSVAPRNFKATIGQYAPQFSGYAQHDSQELLAFLLDGLHEDLNRVTNKPYVELREANGRDDSVVAREAWDAHQMRNRSVIVDLFHGQFKSTVCCPDCNRISITFDPFMFMQLPMPHQDEVLLSIAVVRLDPVATPMRYTLRTQKHSHSIKHVKQMISELENIPAEHLIVCQLGFGYTQGKILQRYSDKSSVAELGNQDLVAYEVNGPRTHVPKPRYTYNYSGTTGGSYYGSTSTTTSSTAMGAAAPAAADALATPDNVHVAVSSRFEEIKTYSYSTNTYKTYVAFGQPFLLSLHARSATNRQVHQMIWDRLRRALIPEEYIAWAAQQQGAAASASTTATATTAAATSTATAADTDVDANGDAEINPTDDADTDAVEMDYDDDEAPQQGGVGAEGVPEAVPAVLPYEVHLSTGDGYYYSNTTPTLLPMDDEPATLLLENDSIFLTWPSKGMLDCKKASETQNHASCAQHRRDPNRQYTIHDCLELFLKEEQLGENDPWYCNVCRELKQATKKFDLWRLPELIVIQLKRFSYTRYWRSKVDMNIDFPIEGLDFDPYLLPGSPDRGNAVYDLYAISNHSGSLGGGHYTAYVRNDLTGKWYHMNDSSCSETDASRIGGPSAYMLFYRRRRNGGEVPETIIPASEVQERTPSC